MKLTQNNNRYLYLGIFAVLCLLYAIFTISKECYELGKIRAINEINKTK